MVLDGYHRFEAQHQRRTRLRASGAPPASGVLLAVEAVDPGFVPLELLAAQRARWRRPSANTTPRSDGIIIPCRGLSPPFKERPWTIQPNACPTWMFTATHCR